MRRSWWLLLLTMAFVPSGRGQELPGGRFPFMAWDYVDDDKALEAMRDAGINSVAFVRPKMLDGCQKYGLKCVVFDERLSGTLWSVPFDGEQFRRNLPAVIKEVGNHPALYGYHIKDEPHEKEFAELAKAVAAVREFAPGKWPYINLFPGYGENYDRYLDSFATVAKPAVLSYDRYSIVGETGSGDVDPNFWSTIAQVRNASQRHKLNFWNIVLSSPHWNYRDLTEADIRLQVWGSLVYGARGIAYYKFISKELPILNADDLGNFRGGPLNQFGRKTPTLEWLRDTNEMVQNIAPVLLKLQSDAVYHIGSVPRLNEGPKENSLVRDIPNGEFVVGDFTHQENGTRYVMVVNKSTKRSAYCNPQFRAAQPNLKYVSPITGQVKSYPVKYYWLAPGQGVLLQLAGK